jgi:hypothetical protein
MPQCGYPHLFCDSCIAILTLPSNAESWILSDAPVLSRCLSKEGEEIFSNKRTPVRYERRLTQSEPADLRGRFDSEVVN